MTKLEKELNELDAQGMCEEQKCYVVAKAWYDTMYTMAEEIERKVLDENEFITDATGCPAMDGLRARHSYEFAYNKAEFSRYLKLFYAECDRRGIEWEWNKTIYGKALNAKKEAEHNLINWFKHQVEDAWVGFIDEDVEMLIRHWKYREKLLDLAMKLNAGHS